MELSRSLLKGFADAINDNSKNVKVSSNVNGTAVIRDGKKFVQVDGSDSLTPISEATDVQDGDRVLVSIENHKATVIGNYSYPPSLRSATGAQQTASQALQEIGYLSSVAITTENLKANVAELGYLTAGEANIAYAKISDLDALRISVEQIEAKGITTETIEAEVAKLGYLKATEADLKYATIEELNASKITADEIKSVVAEVGYLTADAADLKYATIDDLNASKITADEIKTVVAEVGYITADQADLKYATIASLTALEGNFNTLNSKAITTDNLSAKVATLGYATVEELEASKITSDEIKSIVAEVGYLKATEADIKYATIGSLNALEGNFNTLNSKAITTDNLSANVATLGYATVEELEASVVTADEIKATIAEVGYITADDVKATYATIQQLDVQTGRIDVLTGDFASYKTVVADELLTAKGWMAEGSIGDAQISSVSANKLTAGTIDTSVVTVTGSDGRLQIADNTIQISDANRVRVQIGKDSSNDYTLAVWDASGNLIWDALGATENTIQRAIIKDSMVSEDAAIQALKIDFQSFETALTEQGLVISGTVVQVGDKTLNVALSEQTQLITDQGETLADHASRISANEQAIELRVTSQVYEADKTEMNSRLSATETSVELMDDKIEMKVEQTDIDTAIDNLEIGARNLIRNAQTLNFENYYFDSSGYDDPLTVIYDESGNVTLDGVTVTYDDSGNVTLNGVTASHDGSGNVSLAS